MVQKALFPVQGYAFLAESMSEALKGNRTAVESDQVYGALDLTHKSVIDLWLSSYR